jgi:hypothetical protein
MIRDLGMADLKGLRAQDNLTGLLPEGHNSELRKPVIREQADNPMLYLRVPEFKFLRDDPAFQSYVSRNLWENRTDRGYKSHTDVFQFIQDTYKSWIGKGLLQSDIRLLDPKLYNHFQRQMSVARKSSLVPSWIEKDFPKERSEQAIQLVIDPQLSEEERIIRRFQRERSRASRAKKNDI